MSLPWWVETKGAVPPRDKLRLTAAEIKKRVTISQVLRHYGAAVIQIRDKGLGWMSTPCPFHTDRRPSASVNFDLNKFRCHSCDVAGDVIDVVEQVEHLSTKEAMEWIRKNWL